MCEPIYLNTSEVATSSSGDSVLVGAELVEAVSAAQRSFKRCELTEEFMDKYRWIVINVANLTQFDLKYEKEWFDVGRFWDAPSNIAAFSHSSFSGSSTYWAARHHGVSGAALFYLQIPGQMEEHPITIAFSNPVFSHPSTGSIKSRAEFSKDVKEVWKRMDKQCTHDTEKAATLGGVSSKFELTSTPGNQAIVTLRQVSEREKQTDIEFINGPELRERIAKSQQQISFYQPAKPLREKYRWIVISVANLTQFDLKYEKEWFDVGRFWGAPSNIAAFSYSSFSGCNTYWGAASYHGVSGAALFYLQIPGQVEQHPVTIAFSNPSIGSIKTRADFSTEMKEVWTRMDKQCTHNTEKDIGVQGTKLQLTSTPGSQSKVTLTQIHSTATANIS